MAPASRRGQSDAPVDNPCPGQGHAEGEGQAQQGGGQREGSHRVEAAIPLLEEYWQRCCLHEQRPS